MADIASCSRFATAGALCDIHHISRSVLHKIGEDHHIVRSLRRLRHHMDHRLDLRCHPHQHVCSIRGRGRVRGRGGVDCRGRARDGGPGHGPDSDSGLGTLELTLPTSIPSHTYPSPNMFIPRHTCTSPSIPPHIDTSPSLPPHCHAPDPGPTPLADSNRSPGRYTIYTIFYILSIYYTVLGLSLTCSFLERYLYL